MEVLSRGITLRSPLVMYGVEAFVLYRELFHGEPATVRREQAYTRLPDYVGDGKPSIPDGWSPSDVQKLLRLWNDENPATLRWIVDNMATEARAARHAASMAEYVRPMEERQAARRQDEKERKLDRDAATLRERLELFKAHVLSVLTKELLRETRGDIIEFRRRMVTFMEERGEDSAKRITKMFRSSLPALEVVAQLHGARSVELERRIRPQDFWDIEHASLAAVYTDAFVSRDGGLMALLRLRSQPPAAKAVLLHSDEALASWIGELL